MPTFPRAAALSLLLAASALAQRLPGDARPQHYKLALSADLKAKTFSGDETITLELAKPGTEILLNSLGLDITTVELRAGKKQQGKVSYDKTAETARLTFPKSFKAGPATLHIVYRAPLGDHLRGFYLSHTPRRDYAVTQFEGTYARMMFPCFDEPAYKATFDLSVELDGKDTAISNGRIVRDKPAGAGRHTLTFSTSPKMSTYLVALAIGDWDCSEGTADGIPLRVCGVPEKKAETKFSLEAAIHAVTFYNQWFGIRYPFGKLDLLAIPDYEWGGMENTGSIFFRDSALLQDDATTSAAGRRRRASIVAHEIAHQWFGDYVTAAWWDDIWLNEGFASWMAFKPVAAWHPEWHTEDDEALDTQDVISIDSLGATRAIHGDPKTPDEIKEMFDGITYQKGGAVLSMLEAYVGPEAFRQGASAYLKAHANGNATSADFWQAVAQTSGKPVDRIMPTFVLQPGVPMVKVTCGQGGMNVTQQQFLLKPGAMKEEGKSLWQIPLCPKGGACALLEAKSATVAAPGCTFANREAKGYYRTSYEHSALAGIAKTAETALTAPERIALVEDVWAMVRAGVYPVGEFLDLTQLMKAERDQAAIALVSSHLQYLGSSVVAEQQRGAFGELVRGQFAALAGELGWEARAGDSEEQKSLRATLLRTLGDAGDPAAVAAARSLTARYLQSAASVEGTLAGAALAVAARNGDAKLYEDFTAAWGKAANADEAGEYLSSLASFRDPALLERTLGLIDAGRVREQEYPRVFSLLLENPASRDAAWSYLKAHWDRLAELVTSFGGRGAVSALGSFCSVESRDDVTKFFASHKAPGAERALRQGVERMNNCIEFRQLQQGNMQQWLAGR